MGQGQLDASTCCRSLGSSAGMPSCRMASRCRPFTSRPASLTVLASALRRRPPEDKPTLELFFKLPSSDKNVPFGPLLKCGFPQSTLLRLLGTDTLPLLVYLCVRVLSIQDEFIQLKSLSLLALFIRCAAFLPPPPPTSRLSADASLMISGTHPHQSRATSSSRFFHSSRRSWHPRPPSRRQRTAFPSSSPSFRPCSPRPRRGRSRPTLRRRRS